jgi:hypothetical protein
MGNMLPGNSFPQICVVSVYKSGEIIISAQDHERSIALGNRLGLQIDNGSAGFVEQVGLLS